MGSLMPIFRKLAQRVVLVGAIVTVSIGVPLILIYALSWNVRQSVTGIAAGRKPLRVDTIARRVVIRETPFLVGDYYPAESDRPLVILVHGSTRAGRRAALVRALATTLAGRGVPVLALDLTGFGESENPAVPLSEAPRLELDVLEAAGYAVERGLTREGRYAYVGHSLGAGVVLAAGQLEPRPLCIVGLGTPVAAAIRSCVSPARPRVAAGCVSRFP